MNYRKFGGTDLLVSEVGLGAWAIGGPAKVGDVAIGWGNTDDKVSIAAVHAALDRGINFFDTADFYGLGHSEELLGLTLSSELDLVIATKVGHRVADDQSIYTDYSYDHIIHSCEASLGRLKRDCIDFYQMHTAKVADLKDGACIRAMEDLEQAGKIRYWGVSLNTFRPDPEAIYLLNEHIGHGMQLVLNVLNQHALPIIKSAGKKGMGIIARMPLQFGLLTGKFNQQSKFPANDHRNSRISETFITQANQLLEPFFQMAEKYGTSPAGLSISYVLGYPQISTVIPGMRNVEQVTENVDRVVDLSAADIDRIEQLYIHDFPPLLDQMKELG
ncbi:MAG: aldo/keto reductase [Saprospiraceae bacterium]|nr:aldo/keto reductase [Saprospiraceae bacterium]